MSFLGLRGRARGPVFCTLFFLLFTIGFPSSGYSGLTDNDDQDKIVDLGILTKEEIPDYDSILREHIEKASGKLRKISQDLTTTTHWDDQSTRGVFAEVKQVCSTTNQKIEQVSGIVGGVISGATSNLSLPLVGGLGFLGSVATFALSKGAEAIYEKLTHEKHNSDTLNAFIKYLDAYRQKTKTLGELEVTLIADLNLMRLIHFTGGRNTLYTNLYRLADEERDQYQSLKEIIQKVDREHASELKQLKAMILKSTQDVEGMITSLRATTNDELCRRLSAGIDDLTQLENERQSARKQVIDNSGQEGKGLWMQALYQMHMANLGDVDISKSFNNATQLEIKMNHELYRANLNVNPVLKNSPEFKKEKEKAYRKCIKDKIGAYWPVKLAFFYPDRKKQCEDLVLNFNDYTKNYPEDCKNKMGYFCKVRDEQIGKLEQQNKLKDTKISEPSINLFLKTVNNYHKFFNSILEDQTGEEIRKRNKYLELKRQQIEEACSMAHVN